MAVSPALLTREVLPFALRLLALLLATLIVDAGLHLIDAVWVGRYLGIPGVLLIAASFGHSLRKRGVIHGGDPVFLLRLHEWLAWAGSLLVLVHAGIHFNALLAWLAVGDAAAANPARQPGLPAGCSRALAAQHAGLPGSGL